MARPVTDPAPHEPVALSPLPGRRMLTQQALGTLILVAAVLLAPVFVDFHAADLLVQAFAYAIFAISLDLLWGYAGLLSLGHSAFWGLGGYAVGIASTQIASGAAAAVIGIALGVGAAVLLASLIGWITFYSRVTPLYITVITLCTALVLQQLASLTSLTAVSDLTGGYNGLPFQSLRWPIEAWYYAMAGVLAILTALTLRVVHSDFGRVLTGIRDNERRLGYLGFRVAALKLQVFSASALIAAFAGVAYGSYVQFASPELFGLSVASYVLIIVLVGGRGTIIGPVIGAIVVGIVGPTISEQYPRQWQLALGLLFIVAVVLAPRGLIGMLRSGAEALERATRGRLPVTRARDGHSTLVVADPRESRAPRSAPHAVVATVTQVERSYGTLAVLRGVDLEIRSHEILCIIGPNGAGKSTLIDVMTDTRALTDGHVSVGDVDAGAKAPAEIVRLGLGRTFQGTNLMETYSVADSLLIAGRAGRLPALSSRTREIPVTPQVLRLAQGTGLDAALDVQVSQLSHGLRQALELAMVLALDPAVILLDEPTAGLTHEERSDVGRLLRQLADDGLAVVLVEHDLDFVRDITDHVAVLHQGRVQASGPADEVVGSQLVRDIYLGVAAG